jgi:hypothetical protein
MIGVLVFTCAKDRELTPRCIEFLRQRDDVTIILCDDVDHPSGVSGYPTIQWSLRGYGGWAGGVSRCLRDAAELLPEVRTFATVDSDIMLVDPTFFDLPEGILARGCPRPQNQGWFSLRVICRELIPLIQGAKGTEEDKILGGALKKASRGRYLEDGVLLASQSLNPPLGAMQMLGVHAVHVGQIHGDREARVKALQQAENLLEAVAVSR